MEFGNCSLEGTVKNPISLSVTLIRVPSVLRVLMNVGGVWVVVGRWRRGVKEALSCLCVSGCGCHRGLVRSGKGLLTLQSTHWAAGVSKVGEWHTDLPGDAGVLNVHAHISVCERQRKWSGFLLFAWQAARQQQDFQTTYSFFSLPCVLNQGEWCLMSVFVGTCWLRGAEWVLRDWLHVSIVLLCYVM